MRIKTFTALTNQASLSVIEHYQRYISPRKGFACPAGRVYGHGTCSAVIKQIIQQKGTLAGLPEIHAQLSRCQQAAKQLNHFRQHSPWESEQAAVFCCVLPIPL